MSAQGSSDPLKDPGATPKSKKKRNKKKGGGGGNKAEITNGDGNHEKREVEEEDGEEDEQVKLPAPAKDPDDVDDEEHPISSTAQANGTTSHSISSTVALGLARSRSQGGLSPSPPPPSDAAARLDALAKERDTLRQEVTELRKSLESIQEKHEEETSNLQSELDEANESKEHFETQYRNLLGRVNTIKSSLGDRLKADAARLEEAQTRISELEDQNRELQESNDTLTEETSRLRQENESQASEISSLRNRATLSQQNWIKERDDLISREAYAREEFENAKQAMQDWEVLAMDERSLRDNLGERVVELEEQLASLKEAYEKAAGERDTNSQAVDGLQRALQHEHNERRVELRRLVETYQSETDELRKQLQAAEETATSSKATLEATQKELERALPFEKEVKEKNLLIGKLRHEAVALGEHLTKALRILKKGRPEDNVDRQIVTNYILHFLAIDRSDPKKFEALQLIAALLGWTDEQREQAGLARPGASSNSLRIPMSPFRRVPSTPSLNSTDPMLMASSSSNKESLAELWSDFLEREAVEGDRSRRGSQATSPPPRSDTGSGLGISEK
ncbi:uncharacterized protein BDR25DRAFT_71696 [Lindgomyces ingoldianus]|uniref:Uncharacterized protein n=1 Tax=Lindgomyces ingoldianus TaxID=673940 RepID=A0ACB6QLE9_9PLEO|nr:uncharacterized protein BDR25DRAFT_71696 [Lindgomyces ingoldianus]KAF2466957.1 hypothetical protein BDR25DRAFT_71696 [Lindgomyces ingoldianus]